MALPGRIAGASLKEVERHRVEVVGPGSPRQNRRGLIEGIRPSLVWRAYTWRSPRQNRRGLIEGTPAYPGRGPIPGALPGRIAGASLKEYLARGAGAVGESSPRQNRRGLIEARSRSSGTPRPDPALPGRIAGASLKRDCRWYGRRAARRALPGRIAGASLKRPCEVEPVVVLAGALPGRIAGASLKQFRSVPKESALLAALPGRIAGASLKLAAPRRLALALGSLSPAESPGPH